jgi:hypothetical protein
VTSGPTGEGPPTPAAFFADWLSETFDETPTMASALGLVEYDGELGEFSEEAFERRARSARRWAARLAELGWAGPLLPTETSAGPNAGPGPGTGAPPVPPVRAMSVRAMSVQAMSVQAMSVQAMSVQAAQETRVAHALSEDDRVDAALLASHLAGEMVMSEWQSWRRDPDVYLDPCLWGISTLFSQRLRPEAELVGAAVSRLKQVAGVLDHAWSQLDPELASPIVLERAVAAARGGVEFFTDSLPAAIASPKLRELVVGPAEEASAALRRFADRLSELASGASGSFAIGEERYSALLERRELLSLDAGQLHALGQRAWAELDAEMTELAVRVVADGVAANDLYAKDLDAKDPDAKDPDAKDPDAKDLDGSPAVWRSVVTTLFSDHPSSPEELVGAYAEACQQARAFLVDHELVTLPEGERCSVEPSPEFLRPVLAVASYQEPPPFAEGNEGHFFVPFPPSGAGPEEMEQLLADNSWPVIPTVAVHEAYPGHHWQLTFSKRTPRPVRKVITTPYFIEGWALYAEAMMRRQGFFSGPREELSHLDARALRAARVVVDTDLHCGEMGFDDAVGYMTSHTSLTPTIARAEVGRYCAWPTQAASYLVGALELDRLWERWEAEDRGSLRSFHDSIAGSPGLPLPLAAEFLFATPGTSRA